MTEEHLSALLATAEARKDDDGFLRAAEGRTWTLYVSSGGVGLSVSKVEALRSEKGLLHARTNKGERYVLALSDIYAGAVDGSSTAGARKAGFV
ncbi:MAG TPA: hypothetical protein VER33_04520 [Polyangiaceae bacterium]|nr:hypothetical protein [Polyangiaceae bacterium]